MVTINRRIGWAATLIVGMSALTAGVSWATTEPIDSTVPSTMPEGDTTSTSTTLATTTTLDPVAAETAAVSAVAVAARTARMDALVSPDDEAAIAALDEYYTADGAAREEIDSRVQHLLDEGLRVRANPEVPDALTVENVLLLDGPPATQADVTACVVESAVTYAPAAPESSEPEAVIDESFRAFRTVFTLINDEGLWKVETASFVDEWPGETACPPAPPTTTASPTTLDPVAAEQAAVTEAAVAAREARMNALINVDDADAVAALDGYYAEDSPMRSVLNEDLDYLRQRGLRVRQNAETPDALIVESVQLIDGPPATTAGLIVCIVDTGVLYEPGGAPDGSDVIVNDTVQASRYAWTMVLEDGAWQAFEATLVDQWEGQVSCPAA